MPTGYQIGEQDGLYYLTLQVVEWVDLFTRPVYKNIVVESLRYCQQHKGLAIFGYVIMSNHVHLLAQSQTSTLSATIRDFKSYTSKQLLALIDTPAESRREWMLRIFSHAAAQNKRNSSYQLWTQENHAVHCFSPNFTSEKLSYLHQNPVRAGMVRNPEDYPYSSATCYAGIPSLLEVDLIDTPWKTYR